MIIGYDLDFEVLVVKVLFGEWYFNLFFGDGVVWIFGDILNIVYKMVVEIGEFGDNDCMLCVVICCDVLLQVVFVGESVEIVVFVYICWVSVGMISEVNIYLFDGVEEFLVEGCLYVVVVFNGDVDNYVDFKVEEGFVICEEIMIDVKVIFVMMLCCVYEGVMNEEVFCDMVLNFVGLVVIVVVIVENFDCIYLVFCGLGQVLYVGFDEGLYIVVSEFYGFVEQMLSYFCFDGEMLGNLDNLSVSCGQVVVFDCLKVGDLQVVECFVYDGMVLQVMVEDFDMVGIMMCDVDCGDYLYFFFKEILEVLLFFCKMLCGKVCDGCVVFGDEILLFELWQVWVVGELCWVFVIGQGMVVVVGQGVVGVLCEVLGLLCIFGVLDVFEVCVLLVMEFFGFGFEVDMFDCLIVVILQFGMMIDMNCMVDFVCSCGVCVVVIVNCWYSDLMDKVDGVFYMLDGCDVEMSVVLMKVFYLQIVVGFLLVFVLVDVVDFECGFDEF